jgi:hypothetical protein
VSWGFPSYHPRPTDIYSKRFPDVLQRRPSAVDLERHPLHPRQQRRLRMRNDRLVLRQRQLLLAARNHHLPAQQRRCRRRPTRLELLGGPAAGELRHRHSRGDCFFGVRQTGGIAEHRWVFTARLPCVELDLLREWDFNQADSCGFPSSDGPGAEWRCQQDGDGHCC